MSNDFPAPPGDGQGYSRPGGPVGQPEYLQHGTGTPLPPAAPDAASGGARRAVLIGGAAVGALALAGAGAWAALTLAGGGPQPTEALPGDTLGFVSIDLDPSAGQKIEAMKMLNKFPSIKKELGLDPTDDIRKKLFDEAFKDGPCDDKTYDDDVAPWIGSRAAVAAVNGTDGKPAPVVVLQVSDDTKAEQGLAALSECASSGDAVAFVVDDGWAVLAEDQDTAQRVVDDAATGSLADDTTYQKWMDEVGDPGVVTMYASPQAAEAFADQIGDQAAELSALDLGSSLADFDGMAGTVRFHNGAVEIEAASTAVDGAGDNTAAGGLVAGLPADTAAAFGFSVPDGWLERMADRVADLRGGGTTGADLLDELSQESGLDLPADFETLTGDAIAMSVSSDIDLDEMSNSTDPSSLPLGLVIEGDPDAIQGVLDKLTARMGADADLVATDSEGDVVALGPNADYRKSLLDDGGLGDSAAFSSAVPHGTDSTMVVYVNVDAGGGWLDRLVQSDPELASNIEPLSSLGMSAWVDGNASHVILTLTTD
jgi:Protein of unknown function (DUF3352)